MIKVPRAVKPRILEDNAANWTRNLLSARTKKEKDAAESKYRHTSIKAALKSMFHDKCAYCESKISHVSYGHIEHYKPKNTTTYRDLTFEWNNLLLSCPVCNGAGYKGTKFPLAVDGGPFINPCNDEPDDHFDFVYDQAAKLATVVGKTTRGKTTEVQIGLNRNDLRNRRSKWVQMLFVLKDLAQTKAEAAEILRQAKSNDAEYAAFARSLML